MRYLKLVVPFIILLINTFESHAQCPPPPFNFGSQEEIDQFIIDYPECQLLVGDLTISENPMDEITNLEGLRNIRSVFGDLIISNNTSLANLNGLEGITSTRGLQIENNASLESLDGLDNILAFISYLEIKDNDALTDLSSLASVFRIFDQCIISGNNALPSLNGLQNILSVGSWLFIADNDSLTNLDELSNISSMGFYLGIIGNESLTSIDGLQNIDASTITAVDIFTNNNLSICDVNPVCAALSLLPKENFKIYGNDPGCNSEIEVENACMDYTTECPDWDIILTSQEAVNEFPTRYPNCTEIQGDLLIKGDMDDLTPLNQLTSVGIDLSIIENSKLTELQGLNNLTTVEGSLTIDENPTLGNLEGLNSLNFIGSNLNIANNVQLFDLSALSELNFVGENISIVDNDILYNIEGLMNISSSIGGLSVSNNPQLRSLSGLDNIESTGRSVILLNNPKLENLAGLEKLETIGGEFWITNNLNISSIENLQSLTEIAGGLRINGTTNLQSLDGLDNLVVVIGGITLSGNIALSSIDALQNVDPDLLPLLIIEDNPMLSTCEIDPVCEVIFNGSTSVLTIENNAVGCDNEEEVEQACILFSSEEIIAGESVLYPNPADQYIIIDSKGEKHFRIINLQGNTVMARQFKGQMKIDIGRLDPGVYILNINNNEVHRFIKM